MSALFSNRTENNMQSINMQWINKPENKDIPTKFTELTSLSFALAPSEKILDAFFSEWGAHPGTPLGIFSKYPFLSPAVPA